MLTELKSLCLFSNCLFFYACSGAPTHVANPVWFEKNEKQVHEIGKGSAFTPQVTV